MGRARHTMMSPNRSLIHCLGPWIGRGLRSSCNVVFCSNCFCSRLARLGHCHYWTAGAPGPIVFFNSCASETELNQGPPCLGPWIGNGLRSSYVSVCESAISSVLYWSMPDQPKSRGSNHSLSLITHYMNILIFRHFSIAACRAQIRLHRPNRSL